ncbi:transcription factor IIA subunit alpha [Fusarium oxysporum]|nr:transcription factor IIA subunit alpha [Fusarium oxysporum]
MSNPAVGNVYQAIIDEVVNSSRVDFEESGVEESVLEELRQERVREACVINKDECRCVSTPYTIILHEYGETKDSRFR